MLRSISLILLACAAQLAGAAEAGKVVFVAGKATVAEKQVIEGASVQEGQMLATGADGFLYIQTVDAGLFVLRPNTKARIATYHVDTQNPANTQVKLELLSGVARSMSGTAVKQARQNFRFNTPVAAIGVRGTDFTVYADNDTARVAVLSGAIVMSGFGGACSPSGVGPCEGSSSRELSAAQRGQLLQLQRGQQAPQMLNSNPLSPDQVTPVPTAEAGRASVSGGGASTSAGQPTLDVKKTADLVKVADKAPPPVVTPPPVVVTPPPVVVVPDPVPPPVVVVPPPVQAPDAPVVAQLPERGIIWGRFRVVADLPPKFNLPNVKADNELIDMKGNYALLRTPGSDNFVMPNNGSLGFQLRDSEAFVYTDYAGGAYRVETPATLTNGKLNVDFGGKSFSTSFDLASDAANAKLQATGVLGADGRLYGNPADGKVGLINVQGLLSNQNGGSAAYIFDGRLDEMRTANGVTYWEKNKQ